MSLCASFVVVILAVAARELRWNLVGLDAYAGYLIAAALFLALPETFQRQEHLRVTLVIERFSQPVRRYFDFACLLLGVIASAWLTWFAARLVWISYSTHDVSPGADATALWIPQLVMAVGSFGLLVALCDAVVAHWQGRSFFVRTTEAARVE